MPTLYLGGGLLVLLALVVAISFRWGGASKKVDSHENESKTRRKARAIRSDAKRKWLRKNRG